MHKNLFNKQFLIYFLLQIVINSFLLNMAFSEIQEVTVRGSDDSIKTKRRDDRQEAEMNAMQRAIERAGVKIHSKASVLNGILQYESIKSEAKSVLLPGYQIIDMGYSEDGTYQVVLTGKIRIDRKNNPKVDIDKLLSNNNIDTSNFGGINCNNNNKQYRNEHNSSDKNLKIIYEDEFLTRGTLFDITDPEYSKDDQQWINRLRYIKD